MEFFIHTFQASVKRLSSSRKPHSWWKYWQIVKHGATHFYLKFQLCSLQWNWPSVFDITQGTFLYSMKVIPLIYSWYKNLWFWQNEFNFTRLTSVLYNPAQCTPPVDKPSAWCLNWERERERGGGEPSYKQPV